MGATLSSSSSSPTSMDGREKIIMRNNTSTYNHLLVTPGNTKNKNGNFLFDSKIRHSSLSSSSSMLGIAWNFAKKTTTGIPNKEKRNMNRLSSSSSMSSTLSKSHDSAASLTFNSSLSINSSTDQLSAYSSSGSNSSSGDSGIGISRKGTGTNQNYNEMVDKINKNCQNICNSNTNDKYIFNRKKESILSSRIMSVPINNLKKGGSKVRDHILAMTRSKSTHLRTEENGNIIVCRNSSTIESKFRDSLKLSSPIYDYQKNYNSNIDNHMPKTTKNITLTNKNNNSNLYNTAIFNFGIKNDTNVIDNTKKRTVIQASTTELLKGVSLLIRTKCSHKVPDFFSNQLTMWLRSVDRSLIVQGWQDIAFLNPANMVFFFMLLRSMLNDEETFPVNNLEDLQMIVFTCLFISYSYMGNEISYPLKPFISQQDRSKFWDMCVQIVNKYSGDMLQLNTSATFFTQVFTDLKNFATIANT